MKFFIIFSKTRKYSFANMSLSLKFLIVTLLFRLRFAIAVNIEERNSVNSYHSLKNLLREIDSYEPVVRTIINETLFGSFKGTTWNELAYFTDMFGPRLSGSEVLEYSIDYVLNKSLEYGLENVHGEPVTVPRWIR